MRYDNQTPTAHRWSREALPDGRFVFVVRHDHVEGGTKALVLPGILDNLAGGRATRFTYATPSWGYAQHAIAATCRDMGHEAHIFFPARKQHSTPTGMAAEAGAVLHPVRPGYLSVVQKREAEWVAANPGAVRLPFGLDTPAMSSGLANVARSMVPQPPTSARVFVAAGSGTLWRSLMQAWPKNRFAVVQVGRDLDWGGLRPDDLQLQAPEKFEQPAREPPPFPSAANYDAKVWRFINSFAVDGDVFWNVAG